MQGSSYKTRMRRGLVAFGALAVLTVAEYLVAGVEGLLPVLAAVAAAKGLIILQSFMHLSQLWHGEEE